MALDHDDPVTAARLLVDIGDDGAAESALVAESGRIRGEDYVWLVPLAQSLESHERWVGATAVYRALLNGILARGYAPAYGHGARYWARLQRIAAGGASLDPLEPHALFDATLRQKHARKARFWAHVNGTRLQAPRNEDDEDGSALPGGVRSGSSDFWISRLRSADDDWSRAAERLTWF